MKNVPNILSAFRILLVPVFIGVYFFAPGKSNWYAAGVYALAALTDMLDGFIARKYNLITNLGRVLDPLGDKLMTFAVLLCITIDSVIPIWAIVLFVMKEILMLIGGAIIHRVGKKEMPAANFLGKAATTVFFVVCVSLMLFEGISQRVADGMIAFAIVMTFMALGSYVLTFTAVMKESNKKP